MVQLLLLIDKINQKYFVMLIYIFDCTTASASLSLSLHTSTKTNFDYYDRIIIFRKPISSLKSC